MSEPIETSPAAPEQAPAGILLDDLCREDKKQAAAARREMRKAQAELKKQKQPARAKKDQSSGVRVQLKPAGTVTISPAPVQSVPEAELHVVTVRGLPAATTVEQVNEIAKAISSVVPMSVRLGKEIRVGFKTERKAAAFSKGLGGRSCKETGQTITCKVFPPKRSTITIN